MVLFIIAIICALVTIGCFICSVADSDNRETLVGIGIFALILTFGLGIGSCIKAVPTGHTGIVTTFGKVEDYTYEAGVHFDAPWKKIVKMDNRTQKEQIELSCFSSDIQETRVVYTVNFQIDKANAQLIYKTVGKDYFNKIVQPKVLESVKGVFARYNAESLVEKRGVLSTEIQDILSEAVAPFAIQIVGTSIEDIDFTDTFTDAVEQKQVAEQNKLKAQTEQEQAIIEANAAAEKKRIEAEAEAQANIIAAQADAEVAKIGADAAEYQGIKDAAIMRNLGEMLNKYPSLVDYYRVTGWDGQLPETYMGSGDVLFELTN